MQEDKKFQEVPVDGYNYGWNLIMYNDSKNGYETVIEALNAIGINENDSVVHTALIDQVGFSVIYNSGDNKDLIHRQLNVLQEYGLHCETFFQDKEGAKKKESK